MKPKKERAKFWRTALGFVTDNWGLKILALILAVIIYYATKPKDDPSTVPSERIKFERIESEE